MATWGEKVNDIKSNIKEINSAHLLVLYSICRHHERYRLTQLLLNELAVRGFEEKAVKEFDKNFSKIYIDILNNDAL